MNARSRRAILKRISALLPTVAGCGTPSTHQSTTEQTAATEPPEQSINAGQSTPGFAPLGPQIPAVDLPESLGRNSINSVGKVPEPTWQQSFEGGPFQINFTIDITSVRDGFAVLVWSKREDKATASVVWTDSRGKPTERQSVSFFGDVFARGLCSLGRGVAVCAETKGRDPPYGLVSKVTRTGVEWTFRHDYGKWGSVTDVASLGNDAVVVGQTGETKAPDTGDPLLRGWAVRLTPGRSVVWERSLGSIYDDFQTVIGSGDGLMIGGMHREQPLLARVTASGDLRWERRYPFETDYRIKDVTRTDGGYHVVGDGPDQLGEAPSGFLMAVNLEGTVKWWRSFEGGPNDDGVEVPAVINQSGPVACVEVRSPTQKSGTWLGSFTPDGRIQWLGPLLARGKGDFDTLTLGYDQIVSAGSWDVSGKSDDIVRDILITSIKI